MMLLYVSVPGASVVVMILVIRTSYKLYSISARSPQVHIIQNIYHEPLYNIFHSDKKQGQGRMDVEGRWERQYHTAVPVLYMLW